MGFKRNLKNSVKNCELCGKHFDNYKEKFSCRIDKLDDFKQCNTIIVCLKCNNIPLEDVEILKENIRDIRRYLSLKGKVYRTRKKYESK